jgi:hypothetical protein
LSPLIPRLRDAAVWSRRRIDPAIGAPDFTFGQEIRRLPMGNAPPRCDVQPLAVRGDRLPCVADGSLRPRNSVPIPYRKAPAGAKLQSPAPSIANRPARCWRQPRRLRAWPPGSVPGQPRALRGEQLGPVLPIDGQANRFLDFRHCTGPAWIRTKDQGIMSQGPWGRALTPESGFQPAPGS